VTQNTVWNKPTFDSASQFVEVDDSHFQQMRFEKRRTTMAGPSKLSIEFNNTGQ